MKKERITAAVIILLFIGLIPLLNHINRTYFSVESLYYKERGISFGVRNYTGKVTSIFVSSRENDLAAEEEAGEGIIIPGGGVGNVRLGDSPETVEEKWPITWKKYYFSEQIFYRNQEENITLDFRDKKLQAIYVSNSEYQTGEGIGIGSEKEEIFQVFGQPPPEFSGYIVSQAIPGSIARYILSFLIGAALLSVLSLFLIRRKIKRRWAILIPAACFIFYLIFIDPTRLCRLGFEYLFNAFSSLGTLTVYLSIISVPLGICGGILVAEYLCRRYKRGGLTRHIIIIVTSDLGLLTALLVINVAWALVRDNTLVVFWSWTGLYILIYGPLLYLFWYQFNRLFGIREKYLLIDNNGFQGSQER